MKPKLYLESTIPSYYVARPSRDLVTAAHQQITRDWWARRAKDFEICISQVVLDEVGAGDLEMANARRKLIKDFPVLDLSPVAIDLADALMRSGPLPSKAGRDALHIALAAVHHVHFLLTWNSPTSPTQKCSTRFAGFANGTDSAPRSCVRRMN